MIEARSLTKRYGDKTAVSDLSFTVRPGVVTGFLGPNGAGKSTTMRMILGPGPARPPGPSPSTARPTPSTPRRCTRSARCWRPRPSTPGGPRTTTCWRWPRPPGSRARRVDEVIDLVGLRDVAKQAGRRVLARHGAAARHRQRAARRPGDADPGRAGQRPRPRGHPLDPQPAEGPGRRGPDGLRLQPPDVRDGADRRAPDRDRAGQAHRRHVGGRVHLAGLHRQRQGAYA